MEVMFIDSTIPNPTLLEVIVIKSFKTSVACIIVLMFAVFSTNFAHAQKVGPIGVKYATLPLKHQVVLPLSGGRYYGDAVRPNVETLDEFKRLTKGGLFSKGPTIYLDLSNMCKWTDVSGVGNGRVFTFWAHYYIYDENKRARIYRVALPDNEYGWLSRRAVNVKPLPQCSIEGVQVTITFKRTKQEIEEITEILKDQVAQK
ncbi:hypothetical protein A2929_04605 [Candidatus Kaiserbacteria bacterium RIFCSPLOWO2_01_FULL_45_25]|uniref:Uncharacterized protein n=1 Tax=Candidatus Kaiserbacteria bacterium RIFCSPLOWO2_12_FULL_45_26 TaxID=1798525 RepID=A0A1F6FFF9_9BACT|nr:MAG: hypothetical protein A2929_04605 [Candidatus Kaiserbacteria bacterium RIFCSPLOWO2_01_FULL_45_25]OGG84584.1 MAG: hypothetical protein A3G90_00650 [Candidatus Kaiserbacteria bacterium RIFCSPLOWO2_12_FULL_45_26]